MGREDEEGGLLSLLGCSDLSTMLGKRSGGKKSARGHGGDSQVSNREGADSKLTGQRSGRRGRKLLDGGRDKGRPKCRMSGESHEASEKRDGGWEAGAQVNWGESQGSTNGERGRRGVERTREPHDRGERGGG